jgi:hypothetical protein
MQPHKPAVPSALPIGQALRTSPALTRLAQRLRESNGRFASILPCLPDALRDHVQAGPFDERGWSLLASNASVAAKLRHLLPRFEEALCSAGWPPSTIRIRVTK